MLGIVMNPVPGVLVVSGFGFQIIFGFSYPVFFTNGSGPVFILTIGYEYIFSLLFINEEKRGNL